jgi:hypothetical protein
LDGLLFLGDVRNHFKPGIQRITTNHWNLSTN